MYVNSTYNGGMGALNCPGDPGCPGYVAPGSADYQTSLLQAILGNQVAAQDAATAADTGTAATTTSGLSISSSTLLWAGAGLLGIILIMRLGR